MKGGYFFFVFFLPMVTNTRDTGTIVYLFPNIYRVAPQKNGTVDFLGLCSDHQLSLFTLLDRRSFPHYNNTKIIKLFYE